MDVNATLRDMREAYATEDYERCAELADALDQWISAGGYLPTAWVHGDGITARPALLTTTEATDDPRKDHE